MGKLSRVTPVFESEEEYRYCIDDLLQRRDRVGRRAFDIINALERQKTIQGGPGPDESIQREEDNFNQSVEHALAAIPSAAEIAMSGSGNQPRLSSTKRALILRQIHQISEMLKKIRTQLDQTLPIPKFKMR